MNIVDAFTYEFRDPGWPVKMIVQALILVIPVVGWIAAAGWLMVAFANARGGQTELPPAGFHLASGIRLFLVMLVYTIVIYGIPMGLLWIFGHQVPWGQLECSRRSCNQAPSPWAANFYPWSFGLIMLINLLVPSLIVNTHDRGIAGGFDLRLIARHVSADPANWLLAGVTSCFAALIGGFGLCACCVGLLFTIVYQYAVQARVAAWLENSPGVGAYT